MLTPRCTLLPAQLYGLDDSHVAAVRGASSHLIRLQPAAARGIFTHARSRGASWTQLANSRVAIEILRANAVFGHVSGRTATKTKMLLLKILHWSALPGTSRHHWGTDLDVFDPDALGTEKLQLEPWEYAEHGPFAKLNQWLDDHAARFGFYRCYADSATSGVAIEPWHFSYAPLSQAYPEQIQPQELAQRLTAAQLPGLKLVLSQLESNCC